MQTAVVHAEVHGVHKIFDDLAKGEGYDGEIVALQAQYGHTNDDAEITGHSAAHNKGQDQRQPVRESTSYRLTQTSVPENAPTLIKPACPRLSSPKKPTTRFSETAMTT